MGGLRDELRYLLDLGVAQLVGRTPAFPAAPPRTLLSTAAASKPLLSRFGPTVPVAWAAASVWQVEQLSANTLSPGGAFAGTLDDAALPPHPVIASVPSTATSVPARAITPALEPHRRRRARSGSPGVPAFRRDQAISSRMRMAENAVSERTGIVM